MKTILLGKMSDFNNNSLSAGRGKALINAITFIKTIERSSPAKVNFLALQQFKPFASSLTVQGRQTYIPTLRRSRNLNKNSLFKILHALDCIFVYIIKSCINILCYREKINERPWKCQDYTRGFSTFARTYTLSQDTLALHFDI